MRKEFLKGYLMAMMSEGVFAGMSSPTAIAKKAAGIFAKDLPEVLRELAGQMLDQVVGAGVAAAAAGIAARGVRGVWSDLQAQYKRGAERVGRKK